MNRVGHPFLAGTGFTGHMHGITVQRHIPDLLENLLHGAVFTDNAVEIGQGFRFQRQVDGISQIPE